MTAHTKRHGGAKEGHTFGTLLHHISLETALKKLPEGFEKAKLVGAPKFKKLDEDVNKAKAAVQGNKEKGQPQGEGAWQLRSLDTVCTHVRHVYI